MSRPSSRRLVAARIVAAAFVSTAVVVPVATSAQAATAGPSVVSRADVDGDGRADVTSLTRLSGGKAYTLRTTTAAGRTATTRVDTPWLFGREPFVGAVPMDGVRGSEIVLRTETGAHTQYHRVFTWRSGRLVAQKDPSGSLDWITDGAAAFAAGYRLRTVDGVKQLTQISLSRDSWAPGATFSGTRFVARWENGQWRPITARSVKMPANESVYAGAGWNVGSLPRW